MSDPVVALAARGDGLTAAGRFIAGAAPGDLLEDDGSLVPGPHRQTPPCRHFGRCGGCQLQHVDDEAYARFVRDRIASALSAQGLALPDIRKPHLSPPRSRRRVALKALKQGRQVLLGFSEGRSHRIVDIAECPIMADALFALIAPLRDLLRRLLDRRPGEVRMTLCDQGVDLLLRGVEVEGLEATETLTAFARVHGIARLSLDQGFGAQAWWEPAPVTVTLGGVPVPLPEGAFLQATADGAETLVAAVHEAIGHTAATADLFAGLGTFALSLPGKVHAVEGSRDAILALQTAANRAGKPLTAEHRDLFRRPLTASDLARFDAVVLDPPRAGAKEQVAELAVSAVPAVSYVSCNPATFARDAAALVGGGYNLDWIQPVGQFRWSTHVELAAAFTHPA